TFSPCSVTCVTVRQIECRRRGPELCTLVTLDLPNSDTRDTTRRKRCHQSTKFVSRRGRVGAGFRPCTEVAPQTLVQWAFGETQVLALARRAAVAAAGRDFVLW